MMNGLCVFLLLLAIPCLAYIPKKSLCIYFLFLLLRYVSFKFSLLEKWNFCRLSSNGLLFSHPLHSLVPKATWTFHLPSLPIALKFLSYCLHNGLGSCPLFFQLWLVSCFSSGSKPCSHHLSPSNFSPYNNPQYTSPLTPNLHSLLAKSCTLLCPTPTVSYTTSFKSQKLISSSFSSIEINNLQMIFITETILNITLTSKYTILWTTHTITSKTKSLFFPLLSHIFPFFKSSILFLAWRLLITSKTKF